jgi:von Willebrand factor type A domain
LKRARQPRNAVGKDLVRASLGGRARPIVYRARAAEEIAMSKKFLFTLLLSPLTLGLACQSSPKVMPRPGTDPSRPNTGTSAPSSAATGSSGSSGSGASGAIALPDAAPPSATDAASAAGGDANCGFQNFKLESRPAEMLLILDRSGSMRQPPNFLGPTSKWDETVPALHETVMKTATTVQWGLKLFPTDLLECAVSDVIDVPPAPDNYAKMGAAITAARPFGEGTPTRYVMQKAVAYFKATASINARYIVLATDGEPNCADGMTNELEDPDGTVEAVRMAAAAGYKTYVVGIATTMSAAHMTLNLMADAGGTARMGDARYYPVANRQELIAALGLITGQVADCVFPLDKLPPSPNDVAVDVNGTRLVHDPNKMNGWTYGAANKTVEVYGAACDMIKKGGADVKITFGCPGFVIP